MKRPGTCILLIFFGLVALPILSRAEPFVAKVVDLPQDTGAYLVMWPTDTGLLIGTEHGFIRQDGNRWTFVRLPFDTRVTTVIPMGETLYVAGTGFCWAYEHGEWRDTGLKDSFVQGCLFEGRAYLAGLNALYAIEKDGTQRELMHHASPLSYTSIHPVDGKLLHATYSPYKAYVWEKDGFKDITESEGWTEKEAHITWWIQKPDQDDGFAYGIRVLPSWARTQNKWADKLAKIWPQLETIGKNHFLVQIDDELFVPARIGLVCFSLPQARLKWLLNSNDLDGAPYTVRQTPDGYLVCTTGGMSLVINPDEYQQYRLPKGDIYNICPTSKGPVILTSTGPHWANGFPADIVPTSAYRLAESPSGQIAWLEFNSLHWGDRHITLQSVYYPPDGMEMIGEDVVVVLINQALYYVRKEGERTVVKLPAHARSLVQIRESRQVITGTADGAYVYDEHGVECRHFGQGPTKVFHWRNTAMAVDGHGHWFDADGRSLGRMPFSSLFDAFEWQGKLYMAGWFGDGELWVGEVDEKSGQWRALDLPLPSTPLALGAEQDRMIIALNGRIMNVKKIQYLPQPEVQATLRGKSGPAPQGLVNLPADEDEVELALAPPRFAPWRNPDFSYRINHGEWQTIPAGARIQIPRIQFGTTRVAIRAKWAGMESVASYVISRNWPWWLNWPAWLAASGLLLGAGILLVRWRTRRLEFETRRLETIVATRTAELVQANQDLNKANAVKTDFISSINHEIRTPLNGVIGIARMLNEDSPPPRRTMLMHTLQACIDQLRATVEGVLDFAALQQGQLPLHEQVFDAVDLIAGTCAGADPQEGRIRLIPWQNSPLWVRGDAGKLRLILGNYLSNALKYGVPPGAEVHVQTTGLGPSRIQFQLSVQSTGPTLSEEEMERLFTEFTRGSRAQQTQTKGTGLGLALCRRYAAAMGGTTGVESRNALTTFWVRVPFNAAQAPDDNRTDDRSPEGPLPKGRVLAVEDESYNRLILCHYLSNLGYEADWAEDGRTALALAAPGRYALVLADWSLPDMKGDELLRQLKRRLGDPTPPMLVISAYASVDKRNEAIAAGAKGFLPKPIDERVLAMALSEMGRLQPNPGPPTSEPAPWIELDLSTLLKLGEKEQVLPRYTRELQEAWDRILSLVESEPGQSALLVHKLRAQVLVVRAMEASRALGQLERTLNQPGDKEKVGRQVAETSAVLDALVKALNHLS